MTLLNKFITRYTLITLFISLFGYTVNLYGTDKIEWGLSARQGRRKTMEDRHSVENLGGLYFFGVYDGHGGVNAAEFVKEHLYEIFFKAKDETIKERLTNTFLTTDKNFLTSSEFENDKSGTTAVVGVVDANTNKLFVANTGDSRAIVVHEGRVLSATEDHKPGKKSERRRIEGVGGYVSFLDCPRVCGVLGVSRAIGDRDFKNFVIPNPDIYEKSLHEDDILILACDGLWDVMANEDVAVFVHKKFNESGRKNLATHDSVQNTGEEMIDDGNNEKVKLVARALRDRAYEKGSRDNISVLIVKLGLLESTTPTKNMQEQHSSWITRLFKYLSLNSK